MHCSPNSALFQSTLPRRERPQTAPQGQAHSHFNPRSREGSDQPACRSVFLEVISIHAPAKGATCMVGMSGRLSEPFQSTLPRRERHCRKPVCASTKPFQSTLPRRERRVGRARWYEDMIFQSTLPRRERQQKSPRLFPMIFAK